MKNQHDNKTPDMFESHLRAARAWRQRAPKTPGQAPVSPRPVKDK